MADFPEIDRSKDSMAAKIDKEIKRMRKNIDETNYPVGVETLRTLYDAFFEAGPKTAAQFAAMEVACDFLARYPRKKL